MANWRWSWSTGLLFLALCSLPLSAQVDAPTRPVGDTLKSEIYFGLRSADGQAVGDQAWEEFIAQVVAPRFPKGLTILDAKGRSGGSASLDRVKLLILVHPKSPDAEIRLGEIKTEFKKRFGSVRVFHTEQPVRARSED